MQVSLLILCATIVTVIDGKDESWNWNNDNQKTSRVSRYQVYERPEHYESFDNDGSQLGFRPQNLGPYRPNSRPIRPSYQGNKGVLVGPGGPTGIIGRPSRFHEDLDLVPLWIRNDPRYRDYDTCRCRYSFNCPSPGLKFGYCSKGKKYCCFDGKRFPDLLGGQHYPPYPGPPPPRYGPDDHRRPYGNQYGGYQHPSFGGRYQGTYDGAYGHRNEPYGYDSDSDDYGFYGRSLSKNQTQASEEKSKKGITEIKKENKS